MVYPLKQSNRRQAVPGVVPRLFAADRARELHRLRGDHGNEIIHRSNAPTLALPEVKYSPGKKPEGS